MYSKKSMVNLNIAYAYTVHRLTLGCLHIDLDPLNHEALRHYACLVHTNGSSFTDLQGVD
jgi:hypothetical protein